MRTYYLFFTFFVLLPFISYSQTDTLQIPTPISENDDTTGQGEEQDPDFVVAESEQELDQKLHVRFTADGTASTGNIERLLLQTGANFDWKASKVFKFSSSPSFTYGQQSGLLNEREFFADVRLAVFYQRRMYGLAFSSWERSNLRQIKDRWVQAAGIAWKLIEQNKAYLSISNVILHETTDFFLRTDIDLWRNSTRIFGEYAVGKNKFTISHAVLLQPSITHSNNFRWSGTLSFNYRVSKYFSLRNKFENTYESVVVEGRKNSDFRWTLGLMVAY